MQRLAACLPGRTVTSTVKLLDPDLVEAAAMAWCAWRRLTSMPATLAAVTGASRDAHGGGLYLP